ncbi:MAG: copper chaperone PCu(A)C [Rhodanobacteraceae bacterium]
MRALSKILVALVLVAATGATLAQVSAPAAPSIAVSGAWVRWLPGDLPAAAYATVTNTGDELVRLTGATSSDYASIMLHRSVVRDGKSLMQSVAGLDIRSGSSVTLAPGGYHLMLMHARHAIKPGDTVHLQLDFADGGALDAAFVVKPANTDSGG